jgi:hypothetical protein
MARVSEDERNAEGICLSVTDEQAETLRRMRIDEPHALFDAMMRPDGSRAVTVLGGVVMMANVDREGYIVEVREGHWHRPGSAYDPPC